MEDVKIFNQNDLILNINRNYNSDILPLGEWDIFIDILCGDRQYQKEAIKNSIIFLASGRYKKIEDLIDENYAKSNVLQSKYVSGEEFKGKLQLPGKLSCNIDLATGTGKSYIMYGIAQIMLGLGLVDRVLVLCPSITIESGLKEKFKELSGSSELKGSLPDDIHYKNPRIVDGNVTVMAGDICIENIHAVYEGNSSSIHDSFKDKGERTLVLNDESHHIFNQLQCISANTSEGKNIKKWKEFLMNSIYNFKYILGFTGTAYIENEYYIDVIYRYSLRQAIEDKVVKNIDYVQKDESSNEIKIKLQKIYQNHINNKRIYSKVKPLTILVCKDIDNAESLEQELIDFLLEYEKLDKALLKKKVLIVTSNKKHKQNLEKLKDVDKMNNEVEWIVSVSMLTEGWDVKNVFQIVPWEDRAFNSKLLIAQVLGRGLRLPKEYTNPQPKVIVFNHDSWSKNIRQLVSEVLENETKVCSEVLKKGDRLKYNFSVYNLEYTRVETEIEFKRKENKYNYSKIEKEGIKLDSQITSSEKEVIYESVIDNSLNSNEKSKKYKIRYKTYKLDEVIDKIYNEFSIREWEGTILQLGDECYTKDNLPPRERIEAIIRKSMDKVGIKGDSLIEKNTQKIYLTFSTLLRKKNKTVIPKLESTEPFLIDTKEIHKETTATSNLRKDTCVFYSTNYEKDIELEEQKKILGKLIEDESLPRSALKEINEFDFRTPLNIVITKGSPEKRFVEHLSKKSNLKYVYSWIKSRDRGFYSIQYSIRYGGKDSKTRKYKINYFNPDFFIKLKDINGYIYYLVVEIKMDKDDCEENKAKYKSAKEHFDRLNDELELRKINEKYIFHFLSPNGYDEYFQYLRDGILIEGQNKFRCELENLLES